MKLQQKCWSERLYTYTVRPYSKSYPLFFFRETEGYYKHYQTGTSVDNVQRPFQSQCGNRICIATFPVSACSRAAEKQIARKSASSTSERSTWLHVTVIIRPVRRQELVLVAECETRGESHGACREIRLSALVWPVEECCLTHSLPFSFGDSSI